jgi:hypothetical protein
MVHSSRPSAGAEKNTMLKPRRVGHYEGRGWPGFHHHATLCIAVYGFLISEREAIPPSGSHCAWRVKKPAIPDSYRSRGASDPTSTSRSQLDRYAPSSVDGRDRKDAPKMSLLCKQIQKERASDFVTQYYQPAICSIPTAWYHRHHRSLMSMALDLTT